MDYAVKKMKSLWDYEEKEEKTKDETAEDETSLGGNKETSAVENVPWQESGLKPDRLVEKLKVIYNRQPADPSLGLNLYSGCSHDCYYCYNKRGDRYQGPYNKLSKRAKSQDIERDLLKLWRAHDIRPEGSSQPRNPKLGFY
jgi:hypothetical protein